MFDYYTGSTGYSVDRDDPIYVAWVQRSLNQILGIQLVEDGVHGARTQSAVAIFQRTARLGADGRVGPLTEAALIEAGADSPPTAGSSPPIGELETPEPNSADLRNRIVSLALAQRRRWDDGSLLETDAMAYDILTDYWCNGLGLSATAAATAIEQRYAWSAAFICWVLRKAGVGAEFAFSSYHSTYIANAYLNRVQQGANRFWAYTSRERQPELGDLLCTTYAVAGATAPITLAQVRANTSGYHCDIVVQRTPGKLVTLGGNLGDTVGMRNANIDTQRYLVGNYFAILSAA